MLRVLELERRQAMRFCHVCERKTLFVNWRGNNVYHYSYCTKCGVKDWRNFELQMEKQKGES